MILPDQPIIAIGIAVQLPDKLVFFPISVELFRLVIPQIGESPFRLNQSSLLMWIDILTYFQKLENSGYNRLRLKEQVLKKDGQRLIMLITEKPAGFNITLPEIQTTGKRLTAPGVVGIILTEPSCCFAPPQAHCYIDTVSNNMNHLALWENTLPYRQGE